jgi:ABC-2 type transport system ATP-binding protein
VTSTTVPALELVGIGRTRGEHELLAGIDLQIARGECVGLIGPNGVGKTTLLRIVAQLTRPDCGQVSLFGVDVDCGDEIRARATTAFAPHEPPARAALSVRANLVHAARLAQVSDPAGECEQMLRRWELIEVAQSPVDELSRGERQRYGLARADIGNPQLWLLDEPTTALDTAGMALLERELLRTRGDRTTVVASHDVAWLDRVVDRVVELVPAGPRT